MAQTSSFNVLTTFSTSWNVWPSPHPPSIPSCCHAVSSFIISLPAPIAHKSHLASLSGSWALHSLAPSHFIKHVSLSHNFQFLSSSFQCLLESKHLSTSNFHDFAYVLSSQNAPSFSTFPKPLPTSMIQIPPLLYNLTYISVVTIFSTGIVFSLVPYYAFCLEVHLRWEFCFGCCLDCFDFPSPPPFLTITSSRPKFL